MAVAIRSHPSKNGMAKIIMVFRRPKKSTPKPAIGEAARAPNYNSSKEM
jgi:hypothetical protein